MTVASTPVVLTEKLRRPEPAGLSRRRLEDKLLNDIHSRLHLIVAPPGSGKTTLLAGVAATTAIPVAWYRVTAGDAAESALVAHLGRALGDALGIRAAATVTGDLLEALERWPGPAGIVVLDDLHEIAGSPAERALEQFIALRPHGLRVLVGSRRQPEINIPRLRVSGLLQEISSDDLRFRSWEVEELFQAVFREPLSPESAALLTRRTGGWAAGLQLFHLATSGRSAFDRQRAVDDLGGRSKLVRSYLARNVLAELPEDRRLFLLRTCTLGSLTGELCDALLETTGSRRVLDELEQMQLFTSSEDDGETFRYHQVLRTHLEWALVQEYGSAGARQWYSRSGALLESNGDHRAAVQAHARAEDWGSVARLLQVRGAGEGDPAAGADLLLPASVVEHDPWLSLAQARRRAREGLLSAAVEAFRQAENLLDEPDFRDICRRERAVATLWNKGRGRASWGVHTDHWSVPLRAAIQHVGRPGIPTGAETPGGLHRSPAAGSAERLGRGLASLVDGDFVGAMDLLAAVQGDRDADKAHRLIGQLAGTVLNLVTEGGGDPSGRLGSIALEAELAGLPWVARLTRGLEEASLVARGSASWRMQSCLDLLADCDRTGDDWGAALLRLASAIADQIANAQADPSQFADAARRLRDLDAPVLATWAEAFQAVALARSGAVEAHSFAAEIARRATALRLDGPATLALTAVDAASGETAPIRSAWGGAAPNGTVSDPGRSLGFSANGAPSTRPNLVRLAGTRTDVLGIRRVAQLLLHVPAAHGIEVPSGVNLAEDAPTNHTRVARTAPLPDQRLQTVDESIRSAALAVSALTEMQADRVKPETASHALHIRCLGGFGIEIGRRAVDLTPLRPRARALLRLLCLTPHRDVHREYLVDALWPGTDLTIGTRRLQVALSSVRQLLERAGLCGAEVLARQGDAYRLAPPPGSVVDIQVFDNALLEAGAATARGDTQAAMRARTEALAQYRGDALPEDGPADYVIAERERLRLAAAAAAAALAQDNRTLGHSRPALAAARRSVQLDRFQDLGWHMLIQLHEDSGDTSAATLARHEHAQAQAELDVVIG